MIVAKFLLLLCVCSLWCGSAAFAIITGLKSALFGDRGLDRPFTLIWGSGYAIYGIGMASAFLLAVDFGGIVGWLTSESINVMCVIKGMCYGHNS